MGKSYEIALNTYKPFACGIVIHPSIDGCLQLRNEHKLAGSQVESVALRVHPLVLELTGKKSPSTGLESKFSVYHAGAIALIRGAAGDKEFGDAAVRDTQVIALRDRVSATAEPGIREDEAYVSVMLRDGRKLTKHVEHALGSVECPMSDSDLEGKFRELSEGVLPAGQTDQLLQRCWSVESLRSVAVIARGAVPPVRRVSKAI